MADFKISQLAQANVVNKDDLFYLIQNDESKNVKASTLFESIIDPTLAGNIIFGGTPQVMNSAGTISITTTRTDLYGGVAASPNAIANGSILPSSIYLYTEGVSATGRGLGFIDGTPFTTTLYVKYSNSKINLAGAQLVSSYPPEDWVGPTGLRPFPTSLNFVKGSKYIFDVSDPTNAGNVLALSTSIDGTNTIGARYTANVVVNGTPGSAGANIVFTVANTTIDTGGKSYLNFPTGVDGQLKVINLVKTGGGSFVISSNLQNNIALELKRSGDSAFMMYSGNGWILVGASPGLVTSFSGTSDDVPEGQRLYFTNARARAAISAGDSSIIYDAANGTIKANATVLAGLIGTVGFSGNTNAVTEGSLNLYYTNARVYANVSPLLTSKANVTDLTTANVIESASNLYYTNARVSANVINLLPTLAGDNITIAANGRISANVAGASISSLTGNILVTGNLNVTNGITANIWTGIYTANVIESASNLYYTNARVYANVAPLLTSKANVTDLTTANVIESASNLYYTNARVRANVINLLPTLAGDNITIEANGRISANVAGASITSLTGNIQITGNLNVTNSITANIWTGIYTANVIESASNLYYTNARVYANVAPLLTSKANVTDLTTANVIESTSNLYFTNARVYANVSTLLSAKANVTDLTTANVRESTGNLYYTNARVYANVSPLLTAKANVTDLTTANVVESAGNLYYTNARVYANVSPLLTAKANVTDLTTANVRESTGNLYYTNARVYAAIAGNLVLKANVTDLTTANVIESTGNLYYTNARVYANVINLLPTLAGNNISIAANGQISANLSANLSALTGNISIAGNLSVTQTITTGNIITGAGFGGSITGGNLISANYIQGNIWQGLFTANVIESTGNLYFTNARVYANVSPLLTSKANVTDLTTANVIESASNLYYTNARVLAGLVTANLVVTDATILGNLYVQGDVVSLNTATLKIEDKNILLANGAVNAAAADGAGINIDGAQANLTYRYNADKFEFNKSLDVLGTISANAWSGIYASNIIGLTTANVAEVNNLYYTNTRVQNYLQNVAGNIIPSVGNLYDLGSNDKPFRDLWLSGTSIKFSNAGSISSVSNTFVMTDGGGNVILAANSSNIPITSPTGKITADLIAGVPGLSTSNIAEGSNLYYTNVRAQLALQPTIAELRIAITAPTSNVIYVAGNGNDNNTGNTEANALANIHVALARAHEWTTVFVKSGDYTLYNQPVTIGKRVGLVGDNLRTTTIRPSQPSVDMFYVNNACYVTGFTFRGHVSPSAVFSYNPDGSAGVIVTSPYIQNSSSITTTGTGMRVDGRYVRGLRSMVCDSYTQTNEGGIGIHMLHRGYTQLVSVFTICCHIAIKCESGGFCSITNSNASFGTYALYADGVSEPLYFGKLTQDTVGQEFTITNLEQRPNYGDSVLFADFNESKCSRDTGLIVDALAFDLAYQGNSQSNFAALQYWSQTSSAIPNQSPETLAAIAYAKNLATNVVANIRIVSPYQVSNVQQFATSPTLIADATSNIKIAAGFDLISNIIVGGTTGVTDRIIPNNLLANTNAFVNHASNLLYLNNTFIASEVVAFVNATYPGFFANANNFIDFANASTRCAKDVGYILDSIRFDVLHDGNRQAIQAGTYYYNYSTDTTQINNQVVQTGASYNFIGSIMANIITATAVNPTYPQYNVTKCIRDAGLIVDSLGIDLAYDSNTQATFAGLQYWAQTSSSIPNQSPETLAAINYAKNLSTNVLANTTVTGLYQNTVTQTFNALKGTAFEANLIATGFNLISNIISYGTVGVTDRIIPNGYPANTAAAVQQASNLLILNKTFIATEVFAFVNTTYPGFFANANNFVDFTNAATKCQRDVGYMIESVNFDMLHGGNRQAIQAGTYYYNYSSNTTQINNQIVQTGAAYRFISSLLPNILTNTAVTYRYQNSISQNTTAASAATLNEVYTINRDISLISNIIVSGPSVAPTKVSITNTANTNINTINATKILFANKDFIVAELIAYTNQIIFDLPAGNLATQNTTAAPASTYATANLILQNINLITNVITYGPSVAAPKTPIGLTISNDANLVNAATLMIANKDFIKAEVLDYVKTNWATISNGAGTFYTVNNATPLVNNTSTITLLETVFEPIHANSSVSFHQGSYISSSGHTMEYVGSGDTIATALPYLGGIPKQENEVTELRGGKVYFTSTDQRGDFRIGTGLVINRVDGTISGRTFNKALFAVMTPYMLAIEG